MQVISKVLTVLALGTPALAQAAPTCEAQISDLQRALRAVPQYVQLIPPQLPVRLAQGEAAPEIKRVGPVIDVKDGHYSVNQDKASLDHLDGWTKALEGVQRVESLGQLPPSPVYLRMDKDQKVQDALPLMCKVASQRSMSLVVEHAAHPHVLSYTPPEAPEHLRGVLRQIQGLSSAVDKAKAFGEVLQQAIGSCTPALKEFESLAKVPTSERQEEMAKVLGEGLRACKCQGADVPSLQHFLLRMTAPNQPRAYAMPLALKCAGGDAQELRLPGDATTEALVQALAGRQGSLRISLGK